MKLANQYIKDVQSGKAVVGKWVKLAIDRHLQDVERSEQDSYPFYFSIEAANQAINFIKILRHTQGKWAKDHFNLRPEQEFILASVFGWLRKSNNKRRYRKVYNEVARKWGKTEFVSGVALKGLIADNEFDDIRPLVGATSVAAVDAFAAALTSAMEASSQRLWDAAMAKRDVTGAQFAQWIASTVAKGSPESGILFKVRRGQLATVGDVMEAVVMVVREASGGSRKSWDAARQWLCGNVSIDDFPGLR